MEEGGLGDRHRVIVGRAAHLECPADGNLGAGAGGGSEAVVVAGPGIQVELHPRLGRLAQRRASRGLGPRQVVHAGALGRDRVGRRAVGIVFPNAVAPSWPIQ